VHFVDIDLLRRRAAAVACVAVTLGAAVGCSGTDPGTSATPRTTPRGTPSATGSASGSGSASASAPTSAPASVKPSTTLDPIKVTGSYGAAPKISFKAPYRIQKTRVKVLHMGNGATVPGKAPVTVDYYGVDGRTGKVFDESFSKGKAPATFSLSGVIPGFAKGLQGQKVGSRVLIGITGPDGYDQSGGNAQGGINVGDTLLFVADIIATQLPGPVGKAVAPPAGLPKVTDANGVPSISVPKTAPPTKLTTQVLIKGTGAKVAKTEQVTTNSLGVNWSDGKPVFSTYGSTTGPDTTALTATLPGLATALTGQTVGSRVLVIIPPDQGYPTGNATPSVAPKTTLVFVVDILFTQPPAQR